VSAADPVASARLGQDIDLAAARGWAVSEEEEVGACVWAVSAAVTAGLVTVAAVTVTASPARPPSARQERLVGQTQAAAARLSQRLA
jgi:DNA-binding IclR family transcriptional regulator